MESRKLVYAILALSITFSITNSTALCYNTICIDPGHGGDDPGTLGPQEKIDEDEVNLIVAQALKDSINIGEGFISLA